MTYSGGIPGNIPFSSGSSPFSGGGTSLGVLELQLTADPSALKKQLDDVKNYASQIAKDIENQIKQSFNQKFTQPQSTQSQQQNNNFFGGIFSNFNSQSGGAAGQAASKSFSDFFKKGLGGLPLIIAGLFKQNTQAGNAGQSAGKDFSSKFEQSTSPIKAVLNKIFDGSFEQAGRRAFDNVAGVINGAIATAKNFAGQIFSVTKDFQGFESSLRTFFQGNQQQVDKFVADLSHFSATTPFQLQNLQKAAVENLAAGAKPDQIIKDLKILGDVAAGANTDLNELVSTYGRARLMGRVGNEEIQTFQSRGVPVRAELGKMLGASEQEVSQLAADGKLQFSALEEAIKRMTEQGGMYFDAMENKSKTLDGRLSNVSDTFYQFQKNVGMAFEPLMNYGVETLGKLVSSLDSSKGVLGEVRAESQQLVTYLKSDPELVNALNKAVEDLVSGAMHALLSLVKSTAEYLKAHPNAIKDAGRAAEGLVSTFGSVLSTVSSLVGRTSEFAKNAKDAFNYLKQGGDRLTEAISKIPGLNILTADQSKNNQDVQDWLWGKNAPAWRQAIGRTMGYSPASAAPSPVQSPGGISWLTGFFGGGNIGDNVLAQRLQIVTNPDNEHHAGKAYYEREGQRYRNDGGGVERIVKDIVLALNGRQAGTPIPSAEAGTLRYRTTAESGGYGNLAEIVDNQGRVIGRYAHMSGFNKNLKSGDRVAPGEVLGYEGQTGHAEGVHLHVEIPKELWAEYVKGLKSGDYSALQKLQGVSISGGKWTMPSIPQGIEQLKRAYIPASSTSNVTNTGVVRGKNEQIFDQAGLSPTLIDLVKKAEEFAPKAYYDRTQYSVGFGTRARSPNEQITIEQANNRLLQELVVKRSQVQKMVRVPASNNQIDALTSFAFNEGEGALQQSTLLKKLNSGDYQGAAQEFQRWNKASDRVAPGLVTRRDAEMKLFLSGSSGITSVQPVDQTKYTTPTGGTPQNQRDLAIERLKSAQAQWEQILKEYDTKNVASNAAIKQSRELDAQARKMQADQAKSQLQLQASFAPDADTKKVADRQLAQFNTTNEYDEKIITASQQRDDLVKARERKQQAIAESERRKAEITPELYPDPKQRAEELRKLDINMGAEAGTDYTKGINAADTYIKALQEQKQIALDALNITNTLADQEEIKTQDRQRQIDKLNQAYEQTMALLKQQQILAKSDTEKQSIQDQIGKAEEVHKTTVELLQLKNQLDDLKRDKTFLQIYGLPETSDEIQKITKQINALNDKIKSASDASTINLQTLQIQAERGTEQAKLSDRQSALSKESGLSNSQSSVLMGQAKLIQARGGNQYSAAALETEVSLTQEELRYRQEQLQIEQQIAAAKETANSYSDDEIAQLKTNAELVHQLNLATISQQAKTMGKDLADVGKNSLGGFFTNIISGSKNASGAFKDLISTITNQLTQLAVNQLMSGLFGGKGSSLGARFGLSQGSTLFGGSGGSFGSLTGIGGDSLGFANGANFGSQESQFGLMQGISPILRLLTGTPRGATPLSGLSLLGGSEGFGLSEGVGLFGSSDGGLFDSLTGLTGDSLGFSSFGFYAGGMVPNYATGGIASPSSSAIADALDRERKASGKIPVLAALTPGEMVLTVDQAKKFQQLQLGKVLNFDNGGVVGGGNIASAIASQSGVNVHVPINVSGNPPASVDVPKLEKSMRSIVLQEIQRQQRPGGALNNPAG